MPFSADLILQEKKKENALRLVLHLKNINQNRAMWSTKAMRHSQGERRPEGEQRRDRGNNDYKKHPFSLEPGIALLCGHCGMSTDRTKLALINL